MDDRYVHLWSPDKSYFVELGFKTEDSQFYPIARSNIAETPRARPAPQSDEHYMLVAGDYDLLEAVPAPIDGQAHKDTPRFYTSSRYKRDLKKKSPILSDHEEGSDIDLTEISEKRFTSGVSSKLRQ